MKDFLSISPNYFLYEAIFLLVLTASKKRKNKGITSVPSNPRHKCRVAFQRPCFQRSLAVASEFGNAAVLSFFSPVRPASSVVAISSPQTLSRCSFGFVPTNSSLFSLSLTLCLLGVCRYLCYARLLYRSGCGSVTVFETTVHATSIRLPFGTQADTFGALIFSSIHSHHTARLMSSHKLCTSALLLPFASSPLQPSLASLHFTMRLCNTPSSFVPQPLAFPSNAKNQKLRQTLVHTAEVVSRCFLSSQLFVSPLLSTRGRLARTTSETLRRATCFLVFFQRWLKAVFPFLFFGLLQFLGIEFLLRMKFMY